MKTTAEHNERIAKITLATLYPLYVAKVERKGRTNEELLQVIEWLTGFNAQKLNELIAADVDMRTSANRGSGRQQIYYLDNCTTAKPLCGCYDNRDLPGHHNFNVLFQSSNCLL